MLTRPQLTAIRAVLETRLGWEHPLTQAVNRACGETATGSDFSEPGKGYE